VDVKNLQDEEPRSRVSKSKLRLFFRMRGGCVKVLIPPRSIDGVCLLRAGINNIIVCLVAPTTCNPGVEECTRLVFISGGIFRLAGFGLLA